MMKIGKKITLIEVQDWNKLVIETYGIPYNFQQQDGCKSRGTYHFLIPQTVSEFDDFKNESIDEYPGYGDPVEMGVSFESWLKHDITKYGKMDLNRKLWFHRYFYPNVTMIIEDLYKRGVLEEGEYLINIDW